MTTHFLLKYLSGPLARNLSVRPWIHTAAKFFREMFAQEVVCSPIHNSTPYSMAKMRKYRRTLPQLNIFHVFQFSTPLTPDIVEYPHCEIDLLDLQVTLTFVWPFQSPLPPHNPHHFAYPCHPVLLTLNTSNRAKPEDELRKTPNAVEAGWYFLCSKEFLCFQDVLQKPWYCHQCCYHHHSPHLHHPLLHHHHHHHHHHVLHHHHHWNCDQSSSAPHH